MQGGLRHRLLGAFRGDELLQQDLQGLLRKFETVCLQRRFDLPALLLQKIGHHIIQPPGVFHQPVAELGHRCRLLLRFPVELVEVDLQVGKLHPAAGIAEVVEDLFRGRLAALQGDIRGCDSAGDHPEQVVAAHRLEAQALIEKGGNDFFPGIEPGDELLPHHQDDLAMRRGGQ